MFAVREITEFLLEIWEELPQRVVGVTATKLASLPSICALLAAAERLSVCHSKKRDLHLSFFSADRNGVSVGAMLSITSDRRSEEHTSELQSLMRISYAVFCLKKKTRGKYICKDYR